MADLDIMLNGLDALEWRKLRTAHGTAEDIPAAIRGLAEADEDTVDQWYWKLDNHVVLQGSVYDSAYHAIPFMIAFIAAPLIAPIRARAYDLLTEVARGEPGDSDNASIVDDTGARIPLLTACRTRIAAAEPRYQADLLCSEPVVRRKALDLVVSLDVDPAKLRGLLASIDPGDDKAFAEAIKIELADLMD